jgi:hypothetical protein
VLLRPSFERAPNLEHVPYCRVRDDGVRA